ncbi:TELO2-interacting protein 2 [Sphaeramia orbicularis]|uniref:TELO2 interacting protein 2 n=1 Tax=Sphaeramia orbicularis TaxID=375764 RepID=A0A672YF73_9TELE|nr:TELO2-interacting protein 2 [Sphaeramia orbicularis]
MDLPFLLHHLCLSSSSSDEPRPSPPLPPITELLSGLRQQLIGASSSESETSPLIGQLEQVFGEADPHWLFTPPTSSSQEEEGGVERWAELVSVYMGLTEALIGCAALPLWKDDTSPPSELAYQNVPVRAEPVCSALTTLLGTLGNWEEKGGVRGAGGGARGLLLSVAPQVCVFAITHVQPQAWTSSSSRAAARRLQVALLRAGPWRDSAHMLMADGGGGGAVGILGGVLDVLQPQLNRDQWWRCDGVRLVFTWTLLQVTRPSVSAHLPRLLPPSLLLTDHYRPENCMLGVGCLHHIVLNVAPADLRQFNRAEVLYQALFRHLYSTDAVVVKVILACLFDLLLVLEKPPSSLGPASSSLSPASSSRRKPCRHDDVIRLVLTHMEAEHKVALRRVYASALSQYVDRMGVALCRHLRRLERVVLGYLEVSDPPEETSRIQILEVLQKTVKAAWPRMESRLDALLRCLLRLLVDVSSDSQLSDPVKQRLMNQSARSLQLLDACSQGTLRCRLLQVDDTCCSSDVLRCLATVTEAAGGAAPDGSV